jgi:acetylornithine/succinyldiaminopimelate/putrescine aminotransferase
MYASKLFLGLYNDRQEHPERTHATFERVEEVLRLVLENKASDIIEQCSAGVENRRADLTKDQADRIAALIERRCSIEQVEAISDLLIESEISTAEAIEIHETYKIPVSRLEKDIIPVRGGSAWIVDNRGKTYLDMDSNYSATNLGMNNPEIAQGLYNQAMQLISMKEDRVHIPRARFLKNIHSMMPEGLGHFYWQNSGGEAVDKALKIAKAYTQNKGVVAFKGGFHGRTHGAVAVTHNLKYRQPFFLDKEDWVHFVDFNDAGAVEKLFESGEARTVILELIQGEEAGNRPADKEFPAQLRKICDDYGGVMIVDEIQTGFGRTAAKEGQWFACMRYGVTPDIITIGKSFGGGYPVTAVVTNSKISAAMKPGYDGSTFGGNPMAMVAALIATRQMREKNITRNVVERSSQFEKGMAALKEKHPEIGGVRTTGLMLAFELPSPEKVTEFETAMIKNGVKTSLSSGSFVRFLPPLIVTRNDITVLLDAIDKSVAEITGKTPVAEKAE